MNRGRVFGTLAALVLVAAAAVGYFVLTGGPGGGGDDEPPPTCPLTDDRVGTVPDRPALAVKIENLDIARPQIGLADADIVYEQPVEGGITRFIVVYHCQDADRVGPVRSARLVDADVLVQFGQPLFGYAGGVQEVIDQIGNAGIRDVNFNVAGEAYTRDPSRQAPHNLYTTTDALYEAGGTDGGSPDPIFEFAKRLPRRLRGQRVTQIHADFSPQANVFWAYEPGRNVWLRSHDETPHTLEDGTQVTARNVIVMVVEIKPSHIRDPLGNPSPEVEVLGSGPAFIFRDGRVIEGEWVREFAEDVTTFVTTVRGGREVQIPLRPGNMWVELFPSDRPLTFE